MPAGRPMRANLTPLNLTPEPRPAAPSLAQVEAAALRREAQAYRILADARDQLAAAREREAQQGPVGGYDTPLLLPREAAQRLGRSRSTIHRWMTEGHLPVRVVGETRYVDWQAFVAKGAEGN